MSSAFVKNWLANSGYEIYIKNKRVLLPTSQIDIPKYEAKIELGKDFLEKVEIKKKVLSLEEANRMGFFVRKTFDSEGRRRIHLAMANKGLMINAIKELGPNFIEYDPYEKRARIIGPDTGRNAKSTWCLAHRTKKESQLSRRETSVQNLNTLRSDDEETTETGIMESMMDNWYEPEQTSSKTHLDLGKDLPFMITEDNLLLCFPHQSAMQKIGIVGKSGTGKSFCTNSLIGRIKYQWNDNIILLNDSMNQYYALGEPMQNPQFNKELAIVGQQPMPLPVINLYMSAPNVFTNLKPKEEEHLREGTAFRLVNSFHDVLGRWGYFTHKIEKYKLGAPQKYLDDVKAKICRLKTIEQIREELFMEIKMEDQKSKSSMIYKWESAFKGIFEEEFTDNRFLDEPTTEATWTLKTPQGKTMKEHPIIIAMETGIIPVLSTVRAKPQPTYRNRNADILQRLKHHQETNPNAKRLFVNIDELRDLYQKKDNCQAILNELFSQGRYPKMGFVYNLQRYDAISEDIMANTTHLITGTIEREKERNLIMKNYELTKQATQEIGKLKKFEFLAVSNDGDFVTYNKQGHRRVHSGGIFKGRIIPPISNHLTP